jgi:hypothetical protein
MQGVLRDRALAPALISRDPGRSAVNSRVSLDRGDPKQSVETSHLEFGLIDGGAAELATGAPEPSMARRSTSTRQSGSRSFGHVS